MSKQELSELTDEQLIALYNHTEQQVTVYKNKQQALKILLNGGYGALSNEHMRWYSDDLAESITLSGQLSARWVVDRVNKFFNKLYVTTDIDYVIAVDTDSIHLNVEPMIQKVYPNGPPDHESLMTTMEKFSVKIDQVITAAYKELADTLNVFENAMHMKLETICQAIWSGKKHYVMQVWANEGIRYNPPKLKVVGLESVKSSTPKMIRDWMQEAYPMMFGTDSKQLKQFIEQKREEYGQMTFAQIAQPRSVTDLDKKADPITLYQSGTPIHVRASLVYNNEIKVRDLENQLQPIRSGDKMRFCYMRLPNPLRENILGCPDELPVELKDLEQYIDYGLQFDKTFADPIKSLALCAGLDMSDNISIDQFFG